MALLARLEHGGASIYRAWAGGERNVKAREALLAAAEREEANAKLLSLMSTPKGECEKCHTPLALGPRPCPVPSNAHSVRRAGRDTITSARTAAENSCGAAPLEVRHSSGWPKSRARLCPAPTAFAHDLSMSRQASLRAGRPLLRAAPRLCRPLVAEAWR